MWCLYILGFTFIRSTICSADVGTTTLEKIPEDAEYSASGVTYDDGGMGPMFDFARSFINTALPGGFPKDFINETMKSMEGKGGGLKIDEFIPKVLKLFAGYVAALVVGILFLIIFPIVGCCFGCCRLCGNCGGKRKQVVTRNMTLKRRIYEGVMAILIIFIFVGNICTYVSNQRMTVAIDTADKNIKDNLKDIDTFLDLVEEQIEIVGVVNLNITKKQTLENMDQTNLQNRISEYILDQLSGGALKTMETNIETAKTAFDTVTNATDEVHRQFALVRLACQTCTDPTASQQFQDLKARSQQFDNFSSNSVVDKVEDQLKTEITTKLSNLNNQTEKVNKAFTKIEEKVHRVVDEVKKFKTNADSGIDIESYKKKAASIADDARKYDKYRNGVGAGLAAITTLIVTLQIFGLAFGLIGQMKNASPTERSCLSNSGGNMLIASVAFIFIFASLLMLLTTISFAVGSLLERFVCQPLSPPSMELLEVADSYFPTKDTFQADLSNVIRDCRNGKTAYTAFHLNSKFNLTSIDAELKKQQKSIETQMKDALDGIKNIGSVNFTSNASMNSFRDSLHNIDFPGVQKQIDDAEGQTRNRPGVASFLNALSSLKSGVQQLEKVKDQVDDWNAALETGLQTATSKLGATTAMGGVIEKYQRRIINIAEEYVNTTKDNVENKVGKCTPLWNLYNSILLVSVCQYAVDAFNGFWFSIGWCIFFFVPAVIFAVKLAKYYRRMDYVEDEYRSNKVAPADSQVT